MPPGAGFAFGLFLLDPESRRLYRDAVLVPLIPRQFDVLYRLVKHAPGIVAKDDLIRAAWGATAATDNSLAKIIGELRAVLDSDATPSHIETAIGQGYRFAVDVAPAVVRRTDDELDRKLAPHRALIEGFAGLETLDLTRIAQACSIFEGLVGHHGTDPRVHVGLANAYALQYEATRADLAPNIAARELALSHSLEACRIKDSYAEAWATRGFVLGSAGRRLEAIAALQCAVDLDGGNWLHYVRLSNGSWGEARLRAARSTIELMDVPMARCLAATVYIARGAFVPAERELDIGIAASAGESDMTRFSVAGVHWLKGLLHLSRGEDGLAMAAFNCEITLESRGYLYGRECAASTWYAVGGCHLRQGDTAAARAAFAQAIARVPRHPMAHAGLAILDGRRVEDWPVAGPMSVDLAMARAALFLAGGDVRAAAACVDAAFVEAARIDALPEAPPPGNAGWLLPVDPLLNVQRDPGVWLPVLAKLRKRAA